MTAAQLIGLLQHILLVSHIAHEWSITMPLLSIRLSAAITYSASRRAFCPKSFFTLSLRPSPACCGPSVPLSDTYCTSTPFLSVSPTHTHTHTQRVYTPAVQLVSPGSKRCRPPEQTIRRHKKAVLSALRPVWLNKGSGILNTEHGLSSLSFI